jgi:hypothetical protein
MSFRINLHTFAGAAVLLLASTSLTFAQAAPAIKHVTVNLGTNRIEVTGSNFGSSAPKLTLGGQTLHLISVTRDSIEAELPALESGSHPLVLTGGDNPLNNSASIDLPSLTQGAEAPEAPSTPAVAPPPAGSLVLSGWSSYSDNCGAANHCQLYQYTPGTDQLVAGGCGSLYDAISVYMVNASPLSNNEWGCFVNNTDPVNGHTIVGWIQWGTYTGASATGSEQPGATILVLRPLSTADAR